METPHLSNKTATAVAFVGDPEFNPGPDSESEAGLCPKCQAKLIDPAGLGWCKACGFCKSLEEDKARIPLETKPVVRPPSPLGIVEFGQVIAKFPSWVWVMLGGIATIVAVNIPQGMMLPPDTFARALTATMELLIGLVMVFAAQVWALCLLGPEDGRLNFKDAVIPGKLWGMTLRKLPETRGQVWLAAWGLAAMLSAIFIIGDFAHWLNYLPKKTVPPPAVEQPE
ncbi:MAG TPA: hypothetical protein VE988_30920 [Gemmataceae bacterium]|nr:hypothetical protein [Gemmataceae bacterium]